MGSTSPTVGKELFVSALDSASSAHHTCKTCTGWSRSYKGGKTARLWAREGTAQTLSPWGKGQGKAGTSLTATACRPLPEGRESLIHPERESFSSFRPVQFVLIPIAFCSRTTPAWSVHGQAHHRGTSCWLSGKSTLSQADAPSLRCLTLSPVSAGPSFSWLGPPVES